MVGKIKCSLMYSPLSISDLSTATRVRRSASTPRGSQKRAQLTPRLSFLLLVLHPLL